MIESKTTLPTSEEFRRADGGKCRKFLTLFENVGDMAALEATKKVKDERCCLQTRQGLILDVRCHDSP